MATQIPSISGRSTTSALGTPPSIKHRTSSPAEPTKNLPSSSPAFAPSAASQNYASTPEMEMTFTRASRSGQPRKPAPRSSLPPLETAWDDQSMSEEQLLFNPPPPQTGDLTASVLPPRSSYSYLEQTSRGSTRSYDVQEKPAIERLELPERQLSKQEHDQLLGWLGNERIQELDQAISKLYDEVTAQVGENEVIATDCYNQLLKARDIILHRDVARIPQAEYYMEQVEARLKRASESERGARKYAWLIMVWGFLWGGAFLALWILLNHAWFHDLLIPVNLEALLGNFDTFLRAMIWGGIGGVVAVLYSLFNHVSQRDFDTQYNLSYVAKPFLGIVLGATVYMIFQLLLALGLLPSGLQADSGTLTTVTPWLVYPLAWACGFKENRIFGLLDRAIKRIFPGANSAA